MGRATYRGTVLSGRDNFDTWKKDLMNFLRAEDLEDFIDGSAEDPSIDKNGKTAAGSVQVEAVTKEKKAEVKEYGKKGSICNVAVLNSLDEYHKEISAVSRYSEGGLRLRNQEIRCSERRTTCPVVELDLRYQYSNE
jgi:hypothetical protein